MKKIVNNFNFIKKWFIQLEQELISTIRQVKEKYSYLIKPFLILMIIYGLAFYPIIRANFNYIDDLGRVNLGYRTWYGFSRFVSEYLSIFVHSSNYLTDISPLTQIIATFFLSLSSVLVLHLFKKDKKITFINLISVIPIGLSPYFLECISYKYDSPYMALSILVSIFPFLFYGSKNKEKVLFSLIIFLGTIVMCTSYQASSGIIPLMALFLSFKLWKNKEIKDAINILGLTAIGYFIGIIVFKMFIMLPAESYVSNSVLPIKELIPGFLSNLKNYYEYVQNDFRTLWLVLIGLIVVSFIFVQPKESKQNKILTIFISIILIIISGFITFGLYPALEKPLFDPRAMYGFGVFIALIAVNVANNIKIYLPKLFIISLCWCFFTFAFTYGNALSEQKRYIDFRVQSVVNELNQLEMMTTDTLKTIKINGNAGKAPSIDHLPGKYNNIINRLIPQSFGSGWWHEYYFIHYFKIQNIKMDDGDKLLDNLEIVKDTMYYKIETNYEDYILITVK